MDENRVEICRLGLMLVGEFNCGMNQYFFAFDSRRGKILYRQLKKVSLGESWLLNC